MNFKNVDFVDSYIMGRLVNYYNEAINKKIELVIIDIKKQIRTILDKAKMGRFFKLLSRDQFYEKYFI